MIRLGLPGHICLEATKHADHLTRRRGVWRRRFGRRLDHRQGFANEIKSPPHVTVPETPMDMLDGVGKAGSFLTLGQPGVRPALGGLSDMLNAHGERPSRSWGCLGRPTKRTLAPDGRTVGVWTDLLALGWESGMKWRVVVELAGADGTVQSHEISVGGCATVDYSAETLGLTLAEGKKTLAGLQRHLVQAQTEEHCRNRRRCQRCGAQRPLKDMRRRRLTSLFGVVEVRAPRFGPCRCGVASRRTITPAAEIMPDRCTPEYERTLAKMGALLPYRRARSLLEEFFPLGDAPEVETIRQRTMRVGARLERDAVAPPTSSPSSEAGSIALAIDGGHVKSVRSYQVRSFEVAAELRL